MSYVFTTLLTLKPKHEVTEKNLHNTIENGVKYCLKIFLSLGKAVGISHAKRLTRKKHNIYDILFFWAHFSVHINAMFRPSLACFIRPGSTDSRGHIYFHQFNVGTQFSLICWFWKHSPAGVSFCLFVFSGWKVAV